MFDNQARRLAYSVALGQVEIHRAHILLVPNLTEHRLKKPRLQLLHFQPSLPSLQAEKPVAFVGRAVLAVELHQNLESGTAISIIADTGFNPLHPLMPYSARPLAVIDFAVVYATIAQRVVHTEVEFVFALDIPAIMTQMPLAEIGHFPLFNDSLAQSAGRARNSLARRGALTGRRCHAVSSRHAIHRGLPLRQVAPADNGCAKRERGCASLMFCYPIHKDVYWQNNRNPNTLICLKY